VNITHLGNVYAVSTETEIRELADLAARVSVYATKYTSSAAWWGARVQWHIQDMLTAIEIDNDALALRAANAAVKAARYAGSCARIAMDDHDRRVAVCHSAGLTIEETDQVLAILNRAGLRE
jgi:hypothetical protein